MAIVDDIQAVDAGEQVIVNKERTANSIRFRPDSIKMTKSNYIKLMDRIAAKEEAIEKVKEEIKQNIKDEVPYNSIIGKNHPYAAKVAVLENEINILALVPGPMEMIGNRAIRLIDKMYKEVKATSDEIYAEQISENEKLDVTSSENLEKPMNIDVQKIVEENKNEIDQNIENAINDEKTFEENNVKEEVKDYDQMDDESKNIVNEKIESFINGTKNIEAVTEPLVNSIPVEEEVQDKEISEQKKDYNVPNQVSEDEIAKVREIEQFNKYNTINEEAARIQDEVTKANELKEFDFSLNEEPNKQIIVDVPKIVNNSSIKDEVVRDEIIIAPERDEEVKQMDYIEPGAIKENNITDEGRIKPIFVKIDNEEPSFMDMSADEKMRAQEIMEKVLAERKRKEELTVESSKIEADIETQKELEAQAIVLEEEAKKRLEDSTIEAEQARQNYMNAISEKEKELYKIVDENNAMEDSIQSNKEVFASIQEGIASKNKEIENLNIRTRTVQDQIAEYNELNEILSDKPVEDYRGFQKVA